MRKYVFSIRTTLLETAAALFGCCAVALLCGAVPAQAQVFQLPDSDQRKCYREVDPYDEITCEGTGQDGAYIQNPLSYTDNGTTVTDNNTGLVWQKEDDGNLYNWFEATGTYDEYYNPTSFNACGSFGRLPSKKELTSIVDAAIPKPGPTINPVFTNTQSSSYWSSTSSARDSGIAWFVHFGGGIGLVPIGRGVVWFGDKGFTSNVRCVRGSETPGPALTDNGDGTVTDNRTGLIWQQGEPGSMTWASALSYCEELELPLGGSTAWRLPNFKELESLTDDTKSELTIDTSKFPGAKALAYHTSTSYPSTLSLRWFVSFYSGCAGSNGATGGGTLFVRCVRGGRSGSSGNLVTISASAPNAAENPLTEGRFVVTRTEPTTFALTVFYTVSGNATSGSDYTALSGNVTIAAGQTEAEIVVSPIDDAAVENDETVIVMLDADATYDVGTPAGATVTIASDDLPTVTISASLPEAVEYPTTAGQFLVTRTEPTTSALTVNYTVNGSATAGNDYMALPGSVTIAADQTQAPVWVNPINDTEVEGDETVIVTLSADAAYTVGTPSSATVTITENYPPVASEQSVTTAEDAAKAITLVATDVDGDSLTYTVEEDPEHGTLSGTAPNLTYTPAADFNGPDSFTFKANDGTADSNVATVSITVTPANDPPVAAGQSVTTAEDTAKAITLVAADVDGNSLTYTVVAGPAHGTLSGTAPSVTYTPTADYNGPDSFTFKANDGTADSNVATVTITVTPVNDPPVAVGQSVTTPEDTAKAITLVATDVDGNSLTYRVVTLPAHGTLSGTAPNVTYHPTMDYRGPDRFTFKANDGTVDSNTATIEITVTQLTLADALDANIPLLTGGTTPWIAQMIVTHDGVDAAQSGALGNNQKSWIKTTVQGPATISFWWKTSSEAGDKLKFSIDRSVKATRSGEGDWEQQTFPIGSGSHDVKWEFKRNFRGSGGLNCGFIDQVLITQ